MTLKKLLIKYSFILPVFWLGNSTIGLGSSLIGATLPYLATRVGQTAATIGYVMTARFVGFGIAALMTGFIFSRLKYSYYKLTYLATAVGVMGLTMIATPFCRSYWVLMVVQFLSGSATGMYDTAINCFVIYIFGPAHCPPILQMLHFGVSIGGFFAPLVARPFLLMMGPLREKDAYCMSEAHQNVTIEHPLLENSTSPIFDDVPPFAWSYIIVSGINGLVTVLYLSFAFAKVNLKEFPVTRVSRNEKRKCPIDDGSELRFRSAIIALLMVFYFLIVGKEFVFWTHTYSFAICSKLRLDVSTANLLNTVFFVGFLTGRGSGMVVARFLRPRTILTASLLSCLVVTTIFSIWGQESVILTFITITCDGLAVSMIFASGISWIAARTVVTKNISSVWFLGCAAGMSLFPLFVGYLYATPAGPLGLAYLATVTSFVDTAFFGLMTFVARYRTPPPESVDETLLANT